MLHRILNTTTSSTIRSSSSSSISRLSLLRSSSAFHTRAAVSASPKRRIFLGSSILLSSAAAARTFSTSTAMAAPSSSSASTGAKTQLTYDMIMNAKVEGLDAASSSNPLPVLEAKKLGDYIPADGAVIMLVRRPGFFPSESGNGASDASSSSSHPPLLGLVKENLDDELHNFLPSFPGGRLLLHSDISLFKALGQKKLGFFDMINFGMFKKYSGDKDKHGGNMKGEGFVKGAFLVVGSKEQGLLYTHLEEFGKNIDMAPVDAAIARMKGAKQVDGSAPAQPVSQEERTCPAN